jgi:hypothetical protein
MIQFHLKNHKKREVLPNNTQAQSRFVILLKRKIKRAHRLLLNQTVASVSKMINSTLFAENLKTNRFKKKKRANRYGARRLMKRFGR